MLCNRVKESCFSWRCPQTCNHFADRRSNEMGKCCVVSKMRGWGLSFLKKAVLGLGLGLVSTLTLKQHPFTKKDRPRSCVLLTTHIMLGLREGYVNRGDENNNIILILQDVFTKQLILKVTKQTALLHYHSGHRNSVKNSIIKTFRENHFNTLDGQCKDNDYTYIS